MFHEIVLAAEVFDYVRNGKLVVHTERESFESCVARRRTPNFKKCLPCDIEV